MTPTAFLTSYCRTEHTPEWRSLYDDVAHGRRPGAAPLDYVAELAAFRKLTGDARDQQTAYLFDVLDNASDNEPAVVSQSDCVDSNLRQPLCSAATAHVDPATLHLSQRDIDEALAGGEDPLALNMATASYKGRLAGRADEFLAIAQLCKAFGGQPGVDAVLSPGAATVILCERPADVPALRSALLRFRARPVVNDVSCAAPVPAATVIALDCKRPAAAATQVGQALSEAAALVILTSDSAQLTGILAHLRFVCIGAPTTDIITTVLADVATATGRMSTATVLETLPPDDELALLSREAVLFALRAKGPLRAARRMAALARQAGGKRAAARMQSRRHASALWAAATAVVAHVAGGNAPVSLAAAQRGPVVLDDPAPGGGDRATMTAVLASVMAGPALDTLRGQTAESAGHAGAQSLATRLALREALGCAGGTVLTLKAEDTEAGMAFRRDRDLRSRIAGRVKGARHHAVACLRGNLAAVDTIAAHLLVNGRVDAETLSDLLVICDGSQW